MTAYFRHPLRSVQRCSLIASFRRCGPSLAAAFVALMWLPSAVVADEPSGQEALAAAWDSDAGFDCTVLDGVAAPESPEGWFEFSLWANHCYIFHARAVRISSDGIRTLALSHEVVDGVEREVAQFLDGPPRVFERRGSIGRGGWAEEGSEVPASPTAIMTHLSDHYRLRLDGEERIAGRYAVRLDIEPLDSMRYGHRLWLDRATALPLKQLLLDDSGRVLETFQITDLERARLHDGHVRLDKLRQAPPDPWMPGWLPPGYAPQPVSTRSSVHDDAVGHRLFSDGLSSLSLFVEPLDADGQVLSPGMHRLGISYAAVRHADIGGQTMQIVAMGELPPQVLLQIAEQVEWRPERVAVDDDDVAQEPPP
ncbi:MucB/RseB C-terminal domain-containing protein [Halomonas sp. ML-15]|uniref:MucB/RseB C-terminal domain-containing protein n=1 Tax=Halomonas sp. ML-15 TaxID=2773305 RepID=UPI001CD04AA7|nr:MucB/RseB C-terminal domain-containing protein [Halomonas sp. ML-15]